jgi:hypothetical protein
VPPTLTVSGPPPVEANGPSGAVAFYAAFASDREDGGIAPICTPASGALFPLGTTLVTCTARDSDGATTTATLKVNVRDTTPPVITSPRDLAIKSSGPVSRFAPLVIAWLSFLAAEDLVDPDPSVAAAVPVTFLPGATLVAFTATDRFGNVSRRAVNVVVSSESGADPFASVVPPSAQPDFPPANVRDVAVSYGNLSIGLRWKLPKEQDFGYVEITREPGKNGADDTMVYEGARASFRDQRLENGKQYRYLLVVYDDAGNRSTGVAVVALARASAVLAPRDGAVLTRPPTLRWKPVARASYYNAQLFRRERKILSLWPKRAHVQLAARWTFEGRRYELEPGLYTWFVWPGFGRPSVGSYGELLGQGEFIVRRAAAKRP